MNKKDRIIDPLPESFTTEEAAGAFWDTHSTMDYLEYLEPANDVIKIKEHIFQVQVAEDVYERLTQRAKQRHESVPQIVDQILRTGLAKP